MLGLFLLKWIEHFVLVYFVCWSFNLLGSHDRLTD